MTPLLLLAEKIEGLREGDGDVDDMIAVAMGWQRPMLQGVCGPSYPGRNRYEWHDTERQPRGFHPPRYTASLDAAMSLVPENADAASERFRLEAYNSPGVLAPHVRASAWVAGAARVYAATPALALVASSLRARAAMEAGE